MTSRRFQSAFVSAALALLALGLLAACSAEEEEVAAPEILAAETPEPAAPDVGAVYVTVADPGAEDDRIVAARTDVAERVELHESFVDDEGIARMEELPEGIVVPAGEGVVLERGGLHLMLMGLQTDLLQGDTYELVLEFERGGEVTVVVEVVPTVAGHGEHGEHGEHDGHGEHDEHDGHGEHDEHGEHDGHDGMDGE